MQKRTQNQQKKEGRHEHPLAQEISREQRDLNQAAHQEADHDIDEDPDFSAASPNDDLDEGESARLGEDKNDLV